MKSLCSIVVAFVVMAAFSASAHAQSAKWEYMVVSAALNNRSLEQMLNARGAEGWELVAFTRKDVAIFKRKAR